MRLFFRFEAEVGNNGGAFSPIFLDLYPKIEENLDTKEFFHIFSCTGTDLFEHFTVFADDDGFMGCAFAEDFCANGDHFVLILVFSFLEAFDDDGCPVGDLVAEGVEKLFADDLGGDDALGLIRDDIVGEEPRAFHSEFIQLVKDDGYIFAVFRGDRDYRVKGMIFGEAGDGVADLLRVADIRFVDDENGGNVSAFKAAEKLRFHSADAITRFHKEQHYVNVCRRAVGNLHHIGAELVLGLMNTGGIKKNELRFVLGKDSRDLGSRGLGLWRNDGNVFSEELIEPPPYIIDIFFFVFASFAFVKKIDNFISHSHR